MAEKEQKSDFAAERARGGLALPDEAGDATEFLARVEAVARGIGRLHEPVELVVLRIDNWFGPKWLRFSGKAMGAAGISMYRLTMPPFTPNRVVWQRRYKQDGTGDYNETDPGVMLHVRQTTTDNFKRLPQDVAPGAALLWFTGRTAETGRGAIMAYLPGDDGYWTWYAGFVEKDGWQVQSLRGIAREVLTGLENHGTICGLMP